MALSDRLILEHMKRGNVVIDPFRPEQLNTSSYDVCIGEWYFRKTDLRAGQTFFSPYDQEDINALWGEPIQAQSAQKAFWDIGLILPNGFDVEDYVILLRPDELILAHTVEYIGGKNFITTKMQARSTVGRLDLDVCSDAGWGDVGYTNRWTMEVRNRFRDRILALKVGTPVAQIVFFETGPILGPDYAETGNYQTSSTLEELKNSWNPRMMLPKALK